MERKIKERKKKGPSNIDKKYIYFFLKVYPRLYLFMHIEL